MNKCEVYERLPADHVEHRVRNAASVVTLSGNALGERKPLRVPELLDEMHRNTDMNRVATNSGPTALLLRLTLMPHVPLHR